MMRILRMIQLIILLTEMMMRMRRSPVETMLDEDEEEEHPAPANSVPPPVHRVTARMSVRAQTPISLPSDTEVARLLAIPTPPPSPLSPFLSPLPQILSPLPQILSPPLTVSPPTYPLGYRATPPLGTPPLLPIPLPTPSPPLLLPSTDCRAGVSEVTLPPQKRLCIALGLRFKGIPAATNVAGLSQRMTYFVTTIKQDTDEIYRRLDDVHDDRLLMSDQLNMLRRDRHAHARTARLMESEAKLSREAWVQSTDASDTARSEVRALRTTILSQQTEIGELWAANRKRQTQLTKALTLMRTL
ncbi:hypothetical protein Tco_0870978 [Tanacetum coccineum]